MTPQEKAQRLARYINTQIDVTRYAMDLYRHDSEDFDEVVAIVEAMLQRATIPPEYLNNGG